MCLNLPFEVKNQLTFYKVRWFKYTFIQYIRCFKIFWGSANVLFYISLQPFCSANQWTGFCMITASVMKELKWGKNEEKCWVQHILWSSKILFCFWIKAYIFFSNVHIQNVVSTLSNIVKIDVENDNVVSTLSNVVKFNVEKHNVVSMLFYIVNFNFARHNVVSTLIWRCATSRRIST